MDIISWYDDDRYTAQPVGEPQQPQKQPLQGLRCVSKASRRHASPLMLCAAYRRSLGLDYTNSLRFLSVTMDRLSKRLLPDQQDFKMGMMTMDDYLNN